MTERILYLIRHGQSDFDSEEMLSTPRGEQFDPPLSALGREQAEKLAARLLVMDPPAVVYSSTMRRTRETIAPYAVAAGIEVLEDPDLIEAHIGEWERVSFRDILASDESMLHRLRHQEPLWRNAPGVEQLEPFRTRVRGAIEGILERHPQGNVVVVCHGGVINAYLAPILGIDHEMFFLPENTSLNGVVVEGAERRVRFLNDVLHLTDPDLFEDPAPTGA
jgi:2,3-bisphosphoglycerate-dependent phosphoglycerate mutase